MPKDASDTTLRRKQRVLFADRVVQDTTFANKGKNYILLEGNINHKAPMTYSPHYYNMINGAIETTPEELESYIASVPGGETVPDAPTNVSAVAGYQEATITFNPPSNDGGNAITSYTVTSSPGGFTASGSGSPITVTGLTNGTAYTFTVVATNGFGNSAPSSASNSVTPATVPDQPINPIAVAGNAQAIITFTPPVSDGGSPITSYTVTSSPEGITATGSSSPITVTGLTNGTAYTFTVIATNTIGNSLPSSISNSVTPVTIPNPPTSLLGTPGNQEVVIQFTAGNNGGSAITNYKYSTDGVNYTALSPADASSPITITGLTNGTTYNITLKAVNAVGDSIASGSVSVTPESNETIVQIRTTGTTTWVAPAGVSSISYFIVGGGGGGGGSYDGGAGGGGAGGVVLSGTRAVTAGQSYTVVVGAGGAGGIGVGNGGGDGLATAGGDSSFDTITAYGGGIGYGSLDDRSGVGGAQGDADPVTAPTGGKGGRTPQNLFGAGGGGGMSAAGATATSNTNAAGGAGIFSNITGTTVEYGAGGNGGRIQVNANGSSATANTGNGGDGAGSGFADGSTGGAGGSGIVVIVYTTPTVSGSPRVLILGDSNAANIPAQLNLAKADLEYTGAMTFTTKDIYGIDSAYTGSDITTANFDVVLLYTNGGATPQTALGNNINAYLESGGNLIMGVFAWGNVTAVPGLNYSLVSPYVYSGSQSSDGGAISKVVYHPIFIGIDNTIGISVNCTPSIALTSGAVGIGKFPSNNWFLAVKEYSPIKMVGINGYFAFMTWSGGNDQKNILRYVVNSIYWCIGSL
jgi:hypothetical protein